jgi:hypothetical protein
MKVRRRFKHMNIFGNNSRRAEPGLGKLVLVILLSSGLLFATLPQNLAANQDASAPPSQSQQAAPPDAPAPAPQGAPAPAYTQQTPEQMQELVAPIALYPDSLVAQILAAATFPEQVVEADRWLQAHPDLKGDDLAKEVDKQPWDPSVKALTAFPTVLGNMDKNISWTSSLGDAYYNQQQDVMDAVQVMRQKAEQAGNLKTTPQQTVTTDGPNVVIQPVDPQVVYVPAYDPWEVYGYPLGPWPGWYDYPGIWYGGPYLSFGFGFGIGFFGGYGWGWPYWGFNWRGRYATFNNGRYYSHSATFYNRNSYYARGGAAGVRDNVRAGAAGRAFNGDSRAARGYGAPRGQSGVRSGAFSGYGGGGQARAYSSRGSASFGGGGSRGGGFSGGGGGRGGGGGGHGGGGGRHR